MEIAMIGLGRMGANMALRLMRGGHRVVGYDPSEPARQALEASGAQTAASLAALVAKLAAPRAVWLMVPAGEITDATVTALQPLLSAGDTHHRRRQFQLPRYPAPRARPRRPQDRLCRFGYERRHLGSRRGL